MVKLTEYLVEPLGRNKFVNFLFCLFCINISAVSQGGPCLALRLADRLLRCFASNVLGLLSDEVARALVNDAPACAKVNLVDATGNSNPLGEFSLNGFAAFAGLNEDGIALVVRAVLRGQ